MLPKNRNGNKMYRFNKLAKFVSRLQVKSKRKLLNKNRFRWQSQRVHYVKGRDLQSWSLRLRFLTTHSLRDTTHPHIIKHKAKVWHSVHRQTAIKLILKEKSKIVSNLGKKLNSKSYSRHFSSHLCHHLISRGPFKTTQTLWAWQSIILGITNNHNTRLTR